MGVENFLDKANTSGKSSMRDGRGRFVPGNKASVGHTGSGGRPTSEVKAILREDGFAALPRLREIAQDPKHRDYFKANVWLAERGLKDDLEGKAEAPRGHLDLPGWGTVS